MRVLLIGEYSRLHNSLKEGLNIVGHDVLLVGERDGFKNYNVDIEIGAKIFNNGILHLATKFLNKYIGLNLTSLENAYRFYKILPQLKKYDVVQIINEGILKTYPRLEILLFKRLLKHNNCVYLLSCGIDYINVKYAFDKKFKYSILTPLHEDKKLQKYYTHILKKIKPSHYRLHQYLFKMIDGVIATDIDYHLPLLNHPKYIGMLPNPINIEKIKYIRPNINNKLIVFHGVNTSNYIKKGNNYFDDALDIIKEKYPKKVTIIRSENIPYDEYIKLYDSSHILLDQVYAYDQGYNALEAMAKGKVVFTGAEQQWLDYYNLNKNTVAINALPNVDYLVEKLSWLIENPEEILSISNNARNFIMREHHYIDIAKRYVDTWRLNSAT